MISRRRFIAYGSAALIAAPLAVDGQPSEKQYRIALLSAYPHNRGRTGSRVFVQALRELGYTEGRNLQIEA